MQKMWAFQHPNQSLCTESESKSDEFSRFPCSILFINVVLMFSGWNLCFGEFEENPVKIRRKTGRMKLRLQMNELKLRASRSFCVSRTEEEFSPQSRVIVVDVVVGIWKVSAIQYCTFLLAAAFSSLHFSFPTHKTHQLWLQSRFNCLSLLNKPWRDIVSSTMTCALRFLAPDPGQLLSLFFPIFNFLHIPSMFLLHNLFLYVIPININSIHHSKILFSILFSYTYPT